VQGWVNAAFLAPSVAPADRRPTLVCFGNEPFWSLKVAADGRSVCEETCAGPAGLNATMEPEADKRWKISVSRADGGRFVDATVTRVESCSDGMSDFRHAWAATLQLAAGDTLSGCCRLEW
jgi:uncharacterized membrane protein